jgi:hypothetical protein
MPNKEKFTMNNRRIDSRKILSASFFIALLFAFCVFAQQQGGALQEKLAAVKEAAAANQQALHHYQWTETTQVSLKGEVKSTKQASCVYGPDGKVQKTPMAGPPAQAPQESGRHERLKEKVVEKKKDELTDYMEKAKSLIGQYVPPDPNRMQQAFQAGNVSLSSSPAAGVAELVFKNYVLPGDSMTLSFLSAAKKLTNVNVNTYLDNPKDVVTLAVQFDSLPDGTNYTSQTVLVATSKQTQVMITNSNYQKLGQ